MVAVTRDHSVTKRRIPRKMDPNLLRIRIFRIDVSLDKFLAFRCNDEVESNTYTNDISGVILYGTNGTRLGNFDIGRKTLDRSIRSYGVRQTRESPRRDERRG